MGYTFLILETEAVVQTDLKRIITAMDQGNKILMTDKAEVGLVMFEKYTIDIIITNTRLTGDGTGWDFIAQAREANPFIPILVISADSSVDEMLIGFKKYNLMDIISQPYEESEIEQAIKKSKAFLEKIDDEVITVRGHGISKRYQARDIYCAERPKRSSNNRCIIITAYDHGTGEVIETELPLRGSIMELVDKFRHKKTLLRCHQSHLVNPRHIDRVDWRHGKVILTTGRELPIGGAKYKQELDPFVSFTAEI